MTPSSSSDERPVRTLSSRQWLFVIWASYILLPTLGLVLMYGLSLLLWPNDNPNALINQHPIVVALPVVLQLSVPIVAVVAIGWSVLKPLQAMSAAAGKVAKHDLDFRLPSSRVREINQALNAFMGMSAELRVALARQQELEHERQFYISAIAHDLNSPIFALRGYLQGLESGVAVTPERMTHYLSVCQSKVSELERLTADLSAYTQIERLEQTMRCEPLELDTLARDVAEDARPEAAARGVRLTISSDAPAIHCHGDPRLLRRAISNILENAIRYTPAGGEIDLTWEIEGELWRVCVSDSGPGVAPEDLPHLFAPFYRGEASRNRATGGAGLGLAIAQRIMRAHGGTLTAANCPQGGAIFTGSAPMNAALAA
jgi:signal transduction histidine kinase